MQSIQAVHPRNTSYDIIRCVAILIVFSIHCMAELDAHLDTDINTLVSNILHSFQGIGVPLFVLLSGALLLGKQDSPYVFLKKRMGRVLGPFLAWSLILYGIYWIIEPTHYDATSASHPFHSFLNILCFEGIHGVYWYVYLILGLYLIAPILQRFSQVANEQDMSYACMLIACIVVMDTFLPDFLVTKRMVNNNITYIGYFLTGFYTKKYLIQKKLAVPAFTISSLLLLTLSLCNLYLDFMPQNIITYFLAITVFGFMQKLEVKDGLTKKYITFVSRTSYGMYLSHVLLISICVKFGIAECLPVVIFPIAMTIALLIIESLMMYAIEKCKLSKFLGG